MSGSEQVPDGPSGDPDAAGGREADQGVDAVKAALGRARAAAAAKGLRPGRPGRVAGRRQRRSGPAAFSGAYPDARDPQPFANSVDRLVSELGWSRQLAVGGVMSRWAEIVGPQIAEHARPVSFADHVLILDASSTAWATQLRLLAPKLIARIAEELGDGVVTRLVIKAPPAPSWRKGRLHISDGRGPRDTYG